MGAAEEGHAVLKADIPTLNEEAETTRNDLVANGDFDTGIQIAAEFAKLHFANPW